MDNDLYLRGNFFSIFFSFSRELSRVFSRGFSFSVHKSFEVGALCAALPYTLRRGSEQFFLGCLPPPSTPLRMAKLLETYACAPSTERGRGILISGDAKSGSIVYCNARSVIIRSLANPLNVEIYGEHAYPTTVAKFSPNGEWIASGDVSGQVRIWARNEEHTLKFEIRALSGSIDDLDWSFDGQRIVVCGDGKGSTFVKAFLYAIFTLEVQICL